MRRASQQTLQVIMVNKTPYEDRMSEYSCRNKPSFSGKLLCSGDGSASSFNHDLVACCYGRHAPCRTHYSGLWARVLMD